MKIPFLTSKVITLGDCLAQDLSNNDLVYIPDYPDTFYRATGEFHDGYVYLVANNTPELTEIFISPTRPVTVFVLD